MAMGKRNRKRQAEFWVPTAALPAIPGHPFYQRLNAVLAQHGFDAFVEAQCRGYYAEHHGRPSLAPAIYFRTLLIGYFEGIDSERGIAWRLADSLSLRCFCGYALTEATPNHSTISRNRLRGHPNILKRVLVHVAGLNLGLVIRQLVGNATPRGAMALGRALFALLRACWRVSGAAGRRAGSRGAPAGLKLAFFGQHCPEIFASPTLASTTGC